MEFYSRSLKNGLLLLILDPFGTPLSLLSLVIAPYPLPQQCTHSFEADEMSVITYTHSLLRI